MPAWSAQSLTSLSPNEIQAHLPTHLQELIKRASDLLDLSKIILFGSRARGNARENSDFDLAFEFSKKEKWGLFVTEAQEESPSLYDYDLIDLDSCDEKFKQKIFEEGVIIYDRKNRES